MDTRLLRRLTAEKLRDRSTYVVAAVVGTLINVYGQLLVPWFRGAGNPFAVFAHEFDIRPGLTVTSIVIGYAFPCFVGVYSAVATRYRNRRIESVADFPDRKPDPVFRAARDGRLVELGAATRALFECHGVDCAQKILGDEVWDEICSKDAPGDGTVIRFEPEGATYIVSHAPAADGHINVYLARMPEPTDPRSGRSAA